MNAILRGIYSIQLTSIFLEKENYIMIDTRYGLKYRMPHSVVHIVDNSAYTGELPAIVAEDPSLYSTIVVTGAPMGEDNKVVTIVRDDVLNVAFGIGSLGTKDRIKYGQTIDYAHSLLEQGAPVRFMRVTPEGSTYGVSCIIVQWRVDPTDNKMHVRFKTVEFPGEIQLDKFKNTSRLNSTLVKYFKNDSVLDGGYIWKQRVFINNISAGRGKVYNYMANAINSTSQNKAPANVKYEFVTIDTRTNQTCERFYASLVNDDNSNRTDAIDTVNVTVGQRDEGSSIIIPYVNESAVREVYADSITHFKDMIDATSTDEYTKNVYLSMNVNTFDIIYGNYIYNGTDVSSKLPFYQVDMFDSDIPSLSSMNRINTVATSFDTNSPTVLYDKLGPLTYGVTRDGDTVYVGDLYLGTTGNNGSNPMITIVGSINQYTGAVTSLTIPKIYPLKKDGEGNYSVDTSSDSVAIKTIFNDTTAVTGTSSKALNNMVTKGTLKVGDIVALVTSSAFRLYVVESVTPTASTGDKYTLTPAYTKNQLYMALDWSSHASGSIGTGNVIGRTIDDAAFTRIGTTVINTEDGSVWVNDYTYNYDSSSSEFSTGRISITNNSAKFGTCPTDVNITTDIVGAQYDVLVYPEDSVTSWAVNKVSIADGGSGYTVGDTVKFTVGEGTSNTTLVVTEVSETGAVTGISIDPSSTDEVSNVVGVSIATTYTGSTEPAPTGLTITITSADVTPTSFEGTPTEIDRYIVSGVQGSLFRVSSDPTEIPANYYSDEFGINMTSEMGGTRINYGSTGFFDDETINDIEFKWRYSALLVKAYRGQLDPRIMSPTRVPAKYLFDGGHNTIVGQTILPYVEYTPADIINASTIFTSDEKEDVLFTPDIIENIKEFEDIDVKQAMYDLMIHRVYQGIPEDKRPVGPGSGLSLHLDSGITDANTTTLINTSFAKRFDNPNASWDIGGWVDISTGISYTFTKQIVDNLTKHSKTYSVNKPYVGKYTTISSNQYSSYFPDIDTTDWEYRDLLYNSGGNAWIADVNGNLTRRSQRTLKRDSDTSDLIQESNMRTLSQLVYLLQNKIDEYLLEYDDDGVLKTLSDEVNNMFSNWVGNLVDGLDITFERDTNTDGGDILVCNCNVVFRGLILRVPIIVNVNRRNA